MCVRVAGVVFVCECPPPMWKVNVPFFTFYFSRSSGVNIFVPSRRDDDDDVATTVTATTPNDLCQTIIMGKRGYRIRMIMRWQMVSLG